MFSLNYESWFVRKFLGYGEFTDLPNTICELGRAVLGRALLFLLLATIAAVVIGLYATAVWGLLLVAFTDTTMKEFFNIGAEVATWTNVSLCIFWVANTLGAIVGFLMGCSWLKERRQGKREAAKVAYYKVHGEYPKTPIADFAKGIWARIHDKTCTIIKWDNSPEERREREYRERREAFEREVAEQVRLAQAKEQNQDSNNA